MKRILSLLFVTTLTGALCAQPGGGQRPGGGQGQRPEQIMPSSLREGLLKALGRIGTNESEAVLAKELGATSSGTEVALIDRLLTQMAEGEHRFKKEVLGAAKYLIENPPAAPDAPTDANRRAADELWGILIRYKDATFAETAGDLLITDEGDLSRQALRYFREVSGKDAIPILAAAYYGPDTSDRAKGELWGVINDHIDDHPAAGQILVERFKESLVKMAEEDAERARQEAERAANPDAQGGRGSRGGFGGFGGRGGGGSRSTAVRELQRLGEGKDLSAEAITNRRSILTGVKSATSDPDFQAMITSVETRLDELANPTGETSSRFRVSDPREAARRADMQKRIEEFRKGRENRNPPGKKK